MLPSRRIAVMGSDVFRDEYSLAFDGSNDYVDCGTTMESTLQDNFTCSAWVRPVDGRSSLQLFMGTKNNADGDTGWFYWGIHGGGGIVFYYRAQDDPTSKTSNVIFPDGDSGWHHVAISVTKSTSEGLAYYFDGNLVNTDTTASTTSGNWGNFASDKNIFLAAQNANGSASNVFPGKISDMAVYNKALTEAQIKEMYNDRKPFNHKEGSMQNELVHWWRFGDGTLDRWGSNPDASFNRFLVTDEVSPTIGNDLIVNGTFDSDSGWTKGSAWSISGGTATRASGESSNSSIEHAADVITADKTYKYSFDYNIASGNCSAYLGGGTIDTSFSGNTTNSGYITSTTGAEFVLYGLTSAEVTTIDNVQAWLIGGGAGTTANMEEDDVVGDVP
jgi:hypothetical protein